MTNKVKTIPLDATKRKELARKMLARELAEKGLRAIAKEELIYPHHGNVCVHEGAYERLAEFFEAYAKQR